MIGLLGVGFALASTPAVEVSADRVKVDKEVVLAQGRVCLSAGQGVVKADEIEFRPGDRSFEASAVAWTPCTCDPPPWAIEASSVEGTIGEGMEVQGGWLRVCGRKALPLPRVWVSLDPNAPRALFPRFGVNNQGAHLGLPIRFPLAPDVSLDLTSEVYPSGGVRSAGHLKTRQGDLDAAAGVTDGQARGHLSVDAVGSSGKEPWAFEGLWQTDAGYSTDFGDDYFERNPVGPVRRGFAQSGPFRLEHLTADDADGQRPLSGLASLSGESVLGGSFSTAMRLDAEQAEEGWTPRVSSSASYVRGWRIGPIDLGAAMHGSRVDSRDGPFTVDSGAEGHALLSHWGENKAGRWVGRSGFAARWANGDDAPVQRRGWVAGPVHQLRLFRSSGIPFRFRAFAPWSEQGVRPEADLNVAFDGWSASGWANRAMQSATLNRSAEIVNWSVGVGHFEGPLVVYAGTGFQVSDRWRAGWSGSVDALQNEFVRHGPSVEWDPHCDCISARASVEWARDIDLPTAFVRVDLVPGG